MIARKNFVLLIVGTVVLSLCSVSSGGVPDSINYQGKLTTAGGGCLNDTVQMIFSIYPDSLGSPAVWADTQAQVVVKDGVFNVLLGSMNPIPDTVFDGSTKYLGVQVGSDDEMRRLKPMVSVAYAYRAGTGGGWVDDGPVVRLEAASDYVGIGTTTPQGPLQVGEGTFIVDANNDVGIGTTDPESKLHILTAVESAIITLEDETSRPVALRLKNLMGNWSIVSPTNTPQTPGLQFTEGANTRMIIGNNGNVGIGMSEPAQKLDVAGTAQMTGFKMPTGAAGGYVLKSDASGVGTWQPDEIGASPPISGLKGATVVLEGEVTMPTGEGASKRIIIEEPEDENVHFYWASIQIKSGGYQRLGPVQWTIESSRFVGAGQETFPRYELVLTTTGFAGEPPIVKYKVYRIDES